MALQLTEHLIEGGKLPRSSDVLLSRAEHLAEADRELVEAVLMRGQSVRSLARLTGVGRHTLRRRLHRLCRHLTSPRFLDAARALRHLTPEDADLARRRFCQRQPLSRLARDLEISSHLLRRRLDRISAQIALLARARHASGARR